MVTVTESRKRDLGTPEAIVAYLKERYADEGARFRPGQPVRITSRIGLPPEIAPGDVGVMLYDAPGTPFAHVLALHVNGIEMVVSVALDNLAEIDG